jgi:hypothetical protein
METKGSELLGASVLFSAMGALISCCVGYEADVLSAKLVSESGGGCAVEGEADGGNTSPLLAPDVTCTASEVIFAFFDTPGNELPEDKAFGFPSTSITVPSGKRTRFHSRIRQEANGSVFLAEGRMSSGSRQHRPARP